MTLDVENPKLTDRRIPCKNCTNRKLYCHSACSKYLKFREMLDKENDENIKNKFDYEGVKLNTIIRIQRRRRWGRK